MYGTIKQLKEKAHEQGQNDTYVEDILLEQAQLFIDGLPDEEKLSDDDRNEIIESYRKGFLGSDNN